MIGVGRSDGVAAPGLGGALAGVARWIPGEVLVLYGILVVATGPRRDLSLLVLVAAVAGPALVLLGRWSTGRPVTWETWLLAALAAGAGAIWAGTVPGNAYGDLDVVVSHPTRFALAMAALGVVHGLAATTVQRRVASGDEEARRGG